MKVTKAVFPKLLNFCQLHSSIYADKGNEVVNRHSLTGSFPVSWETRKLRSAIATAAAAANMAIADACGYSYLIMFDISSPRQRGQ